MWKCRPVGCPSIKPCASTVASFGLPLRLTVIPRWRLHFAGRPSGPWPRGFSKRTSLNISLRHSLVSNSVLIWARISCAGGRENRDGYLGIAENFLDGTGSGDDRGLAMPAGPQINAAVGLVLDFAATVKEPRVVHIGAPEELGQQKESIVAGKQRLVVVLQVTPAHHVPVELAGLLVVEKW